MNDWLIAAIVLGGTLIVGAIASRIVSSALSKESRPLVVQRLAAPIGSLVFTAFIVGGLIASLGIVEPNALDELPSDVVALLPKVIIGLIVVILGNVAAGFAASAVEQAMSRGAGKSAGAVPTIVKSSILTLTVILAASQVGIDTTIITIAVTAVFFSVGLGAALMVGLGGREVASEVAAARALRRLLSEGDRVAVAELVDGIVVTVHSTSTEFEVDGERLFVPNSRLLEASIRVDRPQAADEA